MTEPLWRIEDGSQCDGVNNFGQRFVGSHVIGHIGGADAKKKSHIAGSNVKLSVAAFSGLNHVPSCSFMFQVTDGVSFGTTTRH